jgi:DNA-directed RNA polymerase specialized sigma24 family protein
MSTEQPVDPSNTDALIERCLRGDQDAWQAIVRNHWRKVFNLAYKFVGRHDEAEDLTQDIFLKIFKALHTFDRRANFQTWLISISREPVHRSLPERRKERETMARGRGRVGAEAGLARAGPAQPARADGPEGDDPARACGAAAVAAAGRRDARSAGVLVSRKSRTSSTCRKAP